MGKATIGRSRTTNGRSAPWRAPDRRARIQVHPLRTSAWVTTSLFATLYQTRRARRESFVCFSVVSAQKQPFRFRPIPATAAVPPTAAENRWGISWQITPRALTEAMAKGGAEAKRAFDAMMTMRKIDVAKIEAARRVTSRKLCVCWAG